MKKRKERHFLDTLNITLGLYVLIALLAIGFAAANASDEPAGDKDPIVENPTEPAYPPSRPVYRPFKPDRLEPGRFPEPGESVGK